MDKNQLKDQVENLQHELDHHKRKVNESKSITKKHQEVKTQKVLLYTMWYT